MKHYIWWIIALLTVAAIIITFSNNTSAPTIKSSQNVTGTPVKTALSSLAITNMKSKKYPGSQITIEQNLPDGTNFHRYIVSYMSDGLKIYGLLTVPIGQKPKDGWPVIIIDHGYIPPAQYSTTDSYALITDPLASRGFMVFKPDYRGNGNSQGTPVQVYVSPDYITDSMNALTSIKKFPDVNPNDIGLWAHSMGGNIALHELVLTNQFKATDIWAGVVGSYPQILAWWHERIANHTITGNDLETANLVLQLQQEHGTPQTNPDFWDSIDPTRFLSDINTPIFIQVGTADEEVPSSFSETLYQNLKNIGKNVQLQTYPGADHNLSPDSTEAILASINFFNLYLK